MRTIWWIIWKEFRQIRRDKQMRGTLLIAPVIQLILLGYAATTDVHDLRLVVCDLDRTSESRQVVRELVSSGYFDVVASVDRAADLEPYFAHQRADVGLVFPDGFERAILTGERTRVQALFDGADAVRASTAVGYAGAIIATRGQRVVMREIERSGRRLEVGSVRLESRLWYNPDLKSVRYMIPGVIALILMITTVGLTASGLVKEREIGTMEQLIVTPLRPYQLMFGKTIPFALIGLIDVVLVTMVAQYWFDVPVRGSLFLLWGLSGIFLLTTLGLGLLVSTFAKTQQQAMLISTLFVMMPFNLLSGFVFPIESMPRVMQWMTYPISLRYFLVIIRGLFLKGVGWAELQDQALAMFGCGVLVMALSILRFRKRLE
ncbi:MAG: ABC transporter permease [Candidatus Latescibacteria bacterium]|nr:ABC transporter permease [Candidatus Latescibacterota bacterium]